MGAIEQLAIWRMEWAEERSDHPLSETLRLAARMMLEKTNEETPGEET